MNNILLQTKYYASENTLNFVKQSNTAIINELINMIQNKNKCCNASELDDYLEVLKISANESYTQLKPVNYSMLDFGTTLKNRKEFKKIGYIIPLQKILDLYWGNPSLRHAIQESDPSPRPTIKLALYMDEISLVNPIGNSEPFYHLFIYHKELIFLI